jgi:hypothetical protein
MLIPLRRNIHNKITVLSSLPGVTLGSDFTQDRALHDGVRLFAAAAAWPELARGEVHVAAPRSSGALLSLVAIRAETVAPA